MYVYRGSAAGLATTTAWTHTSPGHDLVGPSVASAGDVDRDGYADLIVGAYFADFGVGVVHVFLGSGSGLAMTPVWTRRGSGIDWLGRSVAGAGDIDGDGYADVVFGATQQGLSPGRGEVYLHRGNASGVEASAAWSQTGPAVGSWYGISVASASDVEVGGAGAAVL